MPDALSPNCYPILSHKVTQIQNTNKIQNIQIQEIQIQITNTHYSKLAPKMHKLQHIFVCNTTTIITNKTNKNPNNN